MWLYIHVYCHCKDSVSRVPIRAMEDRHEGVRLEEPKLEAQRAEARVGFVR